LLLTVALMLWFSQSIPISKVLLEIKGVSYTS
jgi:hypothetical protein